MTQPQQFTPLSQIELNQELILTIKRNHLLALLHDPHGLNHYADHLVQAQSVLLNGVDPKLNQQLSQVISEIIQQLSHSKKYVGNRKFNALQKWLGIDVEYDAGQVKYVKDLDRLIHEANHLSQRLQIEIQKSQARLQQALGLREQMAAYVVAAEQFYWNILSLAINNRWIILPSAYLKKYIPCKHCKAAMILPCNRCS